MTIIDKRKGNTLFCKLDNGDFFSCDRGDICIKVGKQLALCFNANQKWVQIKMSILDKVTKVNATLTFENI